MRRIRKLGLCAALATLGLLHPSDFALAKTKKQAPKAVTAAARASLKAKLEAVYRERAVVALRNYVPADELHVVVKVTPAERVAEQALPYMPAGVSAQNPGALSDADLHLLATNVRIAVRVSGRYTDTAKKELGDIVVESLALDPSVGDQVSFTTMALPKAADKGVETAQAATEGAEAAAAAAKAQAAAPAGSGAKAAASDAAASAPARAPAAARPANIIMRTEGDPRGDKAKAEKLGRERDDAKKEVASLRAALVSSSSEKQAATAQLAKELSAPKPESKKGAIDHALGLAPAVAALLGMFALAFGLFALARRVAGGFNAVASSFQRIAGTIDAGTQAGTMNLALPLDALGGSGRDQPALAAAGGAGQEAGRSRLLELHKELVEAVLNEGEGTVLEQVSSLVAQKATMLQAIASLELFPREIASRIFTKLKPQDQQRLLQAFSVSGRQGSSLESMIAAAEALRTRLLAGSLRASTMATDDKIVEAVARLEDRAVVDLAEKIDPKDGARLFVYLGNERLSQVLRLGAERGEACFKKLVTSLGQMPQASFAPERDLNLLRSLGAADAKPRNGGSETFVPGYLDLIGRIGDVAGERMLAVLHDVAPALAGQIGEQFITFASFFKVAPSIQAEVATRLSVKELALLVPDLGPAEQTTVVQALTPAKRQFLADEIASRGVDGRSLGAANERQIVRQKVAQILRDLKGDRPFVSLTAAKIAS